MKRTPLSIPEIGMISGTRAAFGAGAALLLGHRLSAEQRRAVGWTLLAVGAMTTVPIVIQLLRSRREFEESTPQSAGGGRMARPEYVS